MIATILTQQGYVEIYSADEDEAERIARRLLGECFDLEHTGVRTWIARPL